MDKKFASLSVILLMGTTLFLTVTLSNIFNKPISKLIRAKEEFAPSGKNSLILGWPLSLKADGTSESTISVFSRNQNNIPTGNKTIRLSTTLGKIKENEAISDKQGLGVFHITSDTPGSAEITATIDNNIQVAQKLTIKFE